MGNELKKLPESELEIMLAVWEEKGEVTSEVLEQRLNKTWKKSTLLNLLSRLKERGFLKCEKRGKINYYTPLIGRDAYVRSESVSLLKKLHNSSLRGLITSLYDGDAITKDDLAQLKELILEAEK